MKNGINTLSRCQTALGTFVKIHLSGAHSESELLEWSTRAFDEIRRIEALMSFHDPDSELSKINREAHLHPVSISQEMRIVLSLAIELGKISGGVFDISVAPELVKRGLLPEQARELPSQGNWASIHISGSHAEFDTPLLLDLGGIAKGYAVDRALSVLPPGIDAEINAGGDVGMSPWPNKDILVRLPGNSGMAIQVEMLRNAIATSGIDFLEGGHHIIHPHTKTPIEEHRSVSVFAPTCMLADALTKVAWMGEASHPILDHYGACALLIDNTGKCQWVGVD